MSVSGKRHIGVNIVIINGVRLAAVSEIKPGWHKSNRFGESLAMNCCAAHRKMDTIAKNKTGQEFRGVEHTHGCVFGFGRWITVVRWTIVLLHFASRRLQMHSAQCVHTNECIECIVRLCVRRVSVFDSIGDVRLSGA